jgi:uncharacterized protein (DUF488 family)
MGPRVLTIGHSSHPLTRFLELLRMHEVDLLLDVRSNPYSKFSPHFNRETLRRAVDGGMLLYGYGGDRLGGRPLDPAFLDDRGKPSYAKITVSRPFQEAIADLIAGLQEQGGNLCLMCSEEDPTDCHRRCLVGAALARHGVVVCHVRGDGTVETEDAVARRSIDDQTSILDVLGWDDR